MAETMDIEAVRKLSDAELEDALRDFEFPLQTLAFRRLGLQAGRFEGQGHLLRDSGQDVQAALIHRVA